MMKHCAMKTCFFYYITMASNLALVLYGAYVFAATYGPQKYFILMLLAPVILALIALRKGADKEERELKKRIRKAHLRKELDELKQYDNVE